jgi:phenylalanyl-tRNA synthetase alpha chain
VALADFLIELDDLLTSAMTAFGEAADATALEAARIEFLGAKSGRLRAVQKCLGTIDKADKPAAGKRFNEVKQEIDTAFEAAEGRLAGRAGASEERCAVDLTLPGRRPHLGHLHPLTQTIEDLKEIMGRLGFSVADGPEIEDEWHNFEALNIPREHPARDPLENFYLATAQSSAGADAMHRRGGGGPLLLRSQTSTVQIRVMERTKPPVRIISLGRVYRPDPADATHYPMFHQIEGLLVDHQVTMADLKSVLRMFAMSYFGGEVHIRFRPSFFPFTEPSVEVDMQWHDRWIEMGGAGMVDPNVLRAVGYDPEEVTGFAFGLGVERVCARRHQVTDIREFYRNDVRFLEQF